MDKNLPDRLKNLFVIDIETVSQFDSYESLPERFKKLWETKYSYTDAKEPVEDFYFNKAGIFAEFGKVIVISVGFYFLKENNKIGLRVKTLFGEEKDILLEFKALLTEKVKNKNVILCAHNGKEFDFPYLSRRFIANGIQLPKWLDLSGKKPWEIPHLDTLELWKFGDRKNYTSLELLAAVFDLPTSKTDLHGSDVNKVFYQNKDVERIAKYCAKDVALTAKIFLKMNFLEGLNEEDIEFI